MKNHIHLCSFEVTFFVLLYFMFSRALLKGSSRLQCNNIYCGNDEIIVIE